jgi:hypothetical protein
VELQFLPQTYTISIDNVVFNKYELTTIGGLGLYVDKNPNEILNFEYMHWYNALSDDIVIGKAMTTMSPFLNNGIEGFDGIEVWVSDERYGRYDNNVVKGEVDGSANRELELSLSNYSVISTVTTTDRTKHYGYVGVLNDVRYLLYAVNVSRGATTNKTQTTIFFKHYNPLEIGKY